MSSTSVKLLAGIAAASGVSQKGSQFEGYLTMNPMHNNALAEVGTLWLVDVDLEGHIVAVAVTLEYSLLGLVRVFRGIRRLLLPVVLALVFLVVLVLFVGRAGSLVAVVGRSHGSEGSAEVS